MTMSGIRPRRSSSGFLSRPKKEKRSRVQYWVRVVLTDKEELLYNNVLRHTISDDMEILEIDTAKEVIIVPMRQVKYISCDASIFPKKE
jgi:hypothetical protein